MRKWTIAAVLCLVFCLSASLALANVPVVESGIVLTYDGNELEDDEVLSGRIYYNIGVELPDDGDSVQLGWGNPDDKQVEWENEPRDLDNGVLMVLPREIMGDHTSEALYLRANENDPNPRRVILQYNRDPLLTSQPRITTTATQAPVLNQQKDWRLDWTVATYLGGEAEFYFVIWKMPNGMTNEYFCSENSLVFDGSIWGTPTAYAGNYDVSVMPFINGRMGRESKVRHFWIDAGESDDRIWIESDPACDEDGNISLLYTDEVKYSIHAPLDADLILFNTGEKIEIIELDENGNAEFHWSPELSDWQGDWYFIAFAEALYFDDDDELVESFVSNSVNVRVTIDSEIQGDFDWTITNENHTVAQDGLVTIAVNQPENELVDYFAAYIPSSDGNSWIADSHWVEANQDHDGQTIIVLPVAKCGPSDTPYNVYVYAIRRGANYKESTHTEPITVTDELITDGAIRISMKKSYETGEPLLIRAYYTSDRDDLRDPWMHITICPVENPGEENEQVGNEWYHEGQGFDFFDPDYSIGWRGTYLLSACIFQKGENGDEDEPIEVYGTRTNFVFEVTAPEENEFGELGVEMPDYAHKGEKISLKIDKVEHAEHYGYWIHRENSSKWVAGDGRNADDFDGEFIIDTNGLEPGTYWVEMYVQARNYQQGNSTRHLALLDEEDTEPEHEGNYYFSTSAFEFDNKLITLIGDDTRFIYYVPGAAGVKLLQDYQSGEGENIIAIAEDGPGVTGCRKWDEDPLGTPHVIYGSSLPDEVDAKWTEPTPLCTVYVYGQLNAPHVDMPWLVNQDDETVTINFYHTENASNYSYWLSYEGKEEPKIDSNRLTPGKLYISVEDLDPNRVYHVYLDTNAANYKNGHDDRMLYVLGSGSEDGISLTAPTSVNIGDVFEVSAYAEGAQDIHIRWDNNDGEIRDRYNSDRIDETYCVDWPTNETVCSFTAFARINDSTILVKRASVTINPPGEDVDYANVPSLTIAEGNSTVTRNEYITATIGEVTYAYEYHINIFNANGDWCADYQWSHAGEVQIPTYNLPAGNYKVGAWVRVHGMYSNGTAENDRVPVTILPTENDQASFWCSATTVRVMEPMTVSIAAPGADRIRFSGGNGWWEEDGWEGDSWYNDDVRWEWHSEKVTIRAEARYNGVWKEIGSKQISITSKGDLALPNLTTIPSKKPADGSNLTFTFGGRPEIERYDIEVTQQWDGHVWNGTAWASDADDDGNITIQTNLSLDTPDRSYMIRVYCFATGYNASSEETTVVTVPELLTEHEIILEADRNESRSNEDDVRFSVSAEGATVIRLYHEGRWDWAPGSEAEFYVQFNEVDLQPVWATACYDEEYADWKEEQLRDVVDDLHFEGMSNVVNIRVSTNGPTSMPEWIHVPEEVVWGDWLPVEIGEGGDAERFHIRIRSDDESFEELWFKEVDSSGTYLMPTAHLDPDTEYQITVDGCRSGFTWSGMEGHYTFTVLPAAEGEETPEAYMIADTETVFTYEPYHVMMYHPNAHYLMAAAELDENGDGIDVNGYWEDTNSVSGEDFWWEEAGEKTLNGYYKVNETDEWTWFGSVTLNVISPWLATPEIIVPRNEDGTVSSTGGLVIEVPLIPNATNYTIEVHPVATMNIICRAELHDYNAVDGILSVTVPAGRMVDGKSYWIDCYVNTDKPGFIESNNSIAVLVRNNTEETDDNITISVDRQYVPVNSDFIVDVSAPGATAIMIRFGDQSRGVAGDTAEEWFNEWQPLEETLYAQAYYGDEELPENLDNFNWESLAWSAPSQIIPMYFEAYGQAEQAGYRMPESIQQGKVLVLRDVYPGEHANEVHANISWGQPEDAEENWVFGDWWQNWNPNTRTIRMSTSALEPGTYWVAVDCSGIGYMTSRSWRQIEILSEEEPMKDEVFLDALDKVETGTAIPINVYAPGAIQVGFAIDLEEGHNPDEHADDFFLQDSEIYYDFENIYINMTTDESSENHTITACAQFEDGGEWLYSDPHAIQVWEPMSFNTSGIPGYFTVGQEDASVTMPKPVNAEAMYIQIHDDWQDDDGWHRNTFYESEALMEDTTIGIGARYLQAGHYIQVDYQAYAEGFTDIYSGKQVQIVSGAGEGEGATLSLAEGADGDIDNILSNENVKFLVTPTEGSTLAAIRFYDGHGYWENGDVITPENHSDWFEDGSAFFWCNYNRNDDPNDMLTVFAEVQLEGQDEWFTTNSLRFTVKAPYSTGEFDFTNHRTMYAVQGETVTVEFTESENADNYWVDVHDSEGNWYEVRNFCNGTMVSINTGNLPEGEYYIVGRAGSSEPGYRWTSSSSERRLCIGESEVTPEMHDATFVTPSGLVDIEEEAFAGIAAEYVRINDGVRWINYRAFANSALKEIFIPDSVEMIEDHTFAGCGTVIIFGYSGSYAERWAEGNGYRFVAVDVD